MFLILLADIYFHYLKCPHFCFNGMTPLIDLHILLFFIRCNILSQCWRYKEPEIYEILTPGISEQLFLLFFSILFPNFQPASIHCLPPLPIAVRVWCVYVWCMVHIVFCIEEQTCLEVGCKTACWDRLGFIIYWSDFLLLDAIWY